MADGDARGQPPSGAETGPEKPASQTIESLRQQQALKLDALPEVVRPVETHQAFAHAVQAFGAPPSEGPVSGEAPPQQGQEHYGQHQQLLYAQHDPTNHHYPHQLNGQEHQQTQGEAPSGHHGEPTPTLHQQQSQIAQAAQLQHEGHGQPHSMGLVLPHPASFAQQLVDPHMSQQQMAQYHQQIAHFQPQAYQQQLAASQYHPAHLHEVPQLYFAQSIPPPHPPPHLQQVYQDAAGAMQDPNKLPDMSIDEAAAAHLTALRNTGRLDGQIAEGHPQQLQLGQAALGHMGIHGSGVPDTGNPHAGRDSYVQAGAQGLMGTGADGGRAPSKRKAWRASHEGQGVVMEGMAEPAADNGRARRKQTRRPDRLCHHEGCFVTPTYNYPNEKKRIFCVTHKLDGMVNVVAKRCAHPDCAVNPRFHYDGNTRGMYCSEHKLDGMVNVIDRRCQESNCKKFPSHNYPGSHKKLFCATHKKEGMVDMSHGNN